MAARVRAVAAAGVLLLGSGCARAWRVAPAPDEPVTLHDRGFTVAVAQPQQLASHHVGPWSFARRSKSTVTFVLRPAPDARPSHELFLSTFAVPTEHWIRLPAAQLFAEMTRDADISVTDVLPDVATKTGAVKSALFVLTRPQDGSPTVLTVACTVPPDANITLCGMLEEIRRRNPPPPTSKAQLQARMLEMNAFLVELLGTARGTLSSTPQPPHTPPTPGW